MRLRHKNAVVLQEHNMPGTIMLRGCTIAEASSPGKTGPLCLERRPGVGISGWHRI
jgi:hypothetical protein